MSTWWRRSAIEVDTLSWLTSSIVTVWVAIVIVVYGAAALTLGGQAGERPTLQIVGVLIMASSAVLVRLGTAPAAGSVAELLSSGVFVMIAVALVLSTAGQLGTPVVAELWWAPLGAALVLMSISPVVPGRVYVPGAIAVALVTAGCAAFVAMAAGDEFPAATTIIASSPVVFAVLGGSVLTSSLISGVEGWRRRYALITDDDDDAGESVARILDAVTDGRLSSEVVPFLARTAAKGVTTSADRERAGSLARLLRDALVDREQQNWLATVIGDRPVLLSDPLRLADSLTIVQRSAVTVLIDGLFGDPEAGVFGVRMELATGEHDAVAVALTVDLALPEGRRTSVLAPYYLTVKSVVRRIEWRNGESLLVAFDLDTDPDPDADDARRTPRSTRPGRGRTVQ